MRASEAIKPSGEPFPNCSGVFESFCARLYEKNCARNSPTPGMIPMMIPNTEEDTATRFMRKTSSKPSKGLPVSLGILCLAGLPINKMKACEMAKSPRTTGIKWKPPRNHEIPKVKRVESRTGSMPTVAKASPSIIETSVFEGALDREYFLSGVTKVNKPQFTKDGF